MPKMNAAVVTSFEEPPHYLQVDVPQPAADEILVDVLAAGLHPRVRSGANGKHYTSTGKLPMIPGVDGVGRRPDGTRIYFSAHDELLGTMAEKTLVRASRSIELPDDTDTVSVAAMMNPAMSSWVALRRRVAIAQGQSVLILGATGNAGTMAVQIAKRLAAGRVIGAGRNAERLRALTELGADQIVQLTDDRDATANALAAAAAEVDIVLDYLWGAPAQDAIAALLRARGDRSRAIDWIQIGAIAGPTIELPSVALRSCNLRVQGSGQGAVAPADYLAELPSLVAEIGDGSFALRARPLPLGDVEQVWSQGDRPGERTVLVP
jgi:NADPH:quinone reductase-like Zn-dependent oxidoreductase